MAKILVGTISGHHKNGRGTAHRWASARRDMTATISTRDRAPGWWLNSASSGTEMMINLNPDGSGAVYVNRNGKVIWTILIGPESMSATDVVNGVKEVDVKTHP